MIRDERRALRVLASALLCTIVAPVAHAHLMNSGLGPFYDGVLHVLMTPGDLLLLLALSLFAGLRGAAPGRTMLFALPLSWVAAGIVGLQSAFEISLPLVATLVLVLAGLLVATDAQFPRWAVFALAISAGLFHGLLNGSAMATTGAGLRGLLGIACAAFVVVALISALAVRLREGWSRIALRVAGSWIAAIGILMLGWTMRGRL